MAGRCARRCGVLAQWQSSGLLIRWFRVRPPGAPPGVSKCHWIGPWTGSWTDVGASMYAAAMTHAPSGHIEQLPSGSWRAKVYAGKDPLTGREIRFRKTRKTEVEAQMELGRLLELARSGRNPDSGVTVAELLDAYVPVAGWEGSTEEAKLGYICRTL